MSQMKRYAQWLDGKGYSPLDKFGRQAKMAQFLAEQQKQEQEIKKASNSKFQSLEGPFISGFHD
tara:strand:+ start:1524 stop:1715 length:192 start_codon:yes stop_codon:yes gene_type:complete